MKSIKRWGTILISVVLLLGCSQQRDGIEDASLPPHPETTPVARPAAPSVSDDAYPMFSEVSSSNSEAENEPPSLEDIRFFEDKVPEGLLASGVFDSNRLGGPQLKISASAKFRVENVYESVMEIEKNVREMEGFILKSELHTYPIKVMESPQADHKILKITRYQRSAQLVVRVPAEKTQMFLQKIGEQMSSVDHRVIESNDLQFEWLQEKLNQIRAQETQQTLEATLPTVRHREKIDVIAEQAQRKEARDRASLQHRILSDQIRYSTVYLELYQAEKVSKEIYPDIQKIIQGNQPGFWSQLGNAIVKGWTGFSQILVFLMHFWVLWVMAAGILGILYIFRQRTSSLKPAREETPKTDP